MKCKIEIEGEEDQKAEAFGNTSYIYIIGVAICIK
jgi:hypothetical protein